MHGLWLRDTNSMQYERYMRQRERERASRRRKEAKEASRTAWGRKHLSSVTARLRKAEAAWVHAERRRQGLTVAELVFKGLGFTRSQVRALLMGAETPDSTDC